MSSQLVVNHAPEVVERKVSTTRVSLAIRLVISGISLAVLGGLYAWRRSQFSDEVVWLLGLSVGVTLLICLGHFLWYRRIRSERRVTGQGPALVMSSSGVETAEGSMSWEQLEQLRAIPGARRGHGYRLEAVGQDGRSLKVPLEALDMLPGTLDAAARAYSYGRHGVDLSAVDD